MNCPLCCLGLAVRKSCECLSLVHWMIVSILAHGHYCLIDDKELGKLHVEVVLWSHGLVKDKCRMDDCDADQVVARRAIGEIQQCPPEIQLYYFLLPSPFFSSHPLFPSPLLPRHIFSLPLLVVKSY